MRIEDFVDLLERAVRESSLLPEVISQLQQLVWKSSELPPAGEEVLRNLAYDLDFFEPNPTFRKEDPSFFDETTAIAEISQAIARLKELASGFGSRDV
jgi:hypothetical protein